MLIQEMTSAECEKILATATLFRLACAWKNQPYIIPVYLAFHESTTGEPCLYGFTTPGQKTEWMNANPLVCVEFEDVTSYNQWTSIAIFGRYEELLDTPDRAEERLHAHHLLQEQAHWWEPASAVHAGKSLNKQLGPMKLLYYRIRVGEISGRRAVPAAEDT